MRAVALAMLALASAACGGRGSTSGSSMSYRDAASGDAVPILDQVEPTGTVVRFSTDTETSPLVVTIRGSGFDTNSRVLLPALIGDGAGIAASLVSPYELRITLEHRWLETRAQTVSVQVRTN